MPFPPPLQPSRNVDREEVYEILEVLEFTSDRRRMSIIVRNSEGIFLYCKGADSVICERLSAVSDAQGTKHTITEAIDDFSRLGLRTLAFAYAKMSEEQYLEFREQYDLAARALKERERLVGEAADTIERDLVLLGASAIEDRLQDEVPETIDYLLKVWLVRGDFTTQAEFF
jgi:magnesium-transporting ATPase (P-type)